MSTLTIRCVVSGLRTCWGCILLNISGLILLFLGANLLLGGVVEIAKYFELSKVVIGLAIVAIGTSLPEPATSSVAAKGGKPMLL